MSGEIVSLIIDCSLIVLLAGVIVMAFRLQRRLVALRSGQHELRETIGNLNAAINDAQRSVASLKMSAKEAQGTLGEDIKQASALSEELKLITEAGNNLADRIEQGLTRQRPSQGAGSSPVTSASGQLTEPNQRDLSSSGQGSDQTAAAVKEQQALLAALKEAR